MGLLEDALRETLAAKVAAVPTIEAHADRAIRAAGLIRRRRAVGFTAGAVVGVLALTLSAGFVATSAGRRIAPGSGSMNLAAPVFPASANAPAYVLTGGEIVGPTGSVVSLHGLLATRAWRLASAYLVERRATVGSGVSLWHVPVGAGSGTEVVEADDIVVAPAGQAGLPVDLGPVIAWSLGRTVSWGRLDGADLVTMGSTTVSSGLRVGGVVDGGVLLTTGDSYDLWFPTAGGFVAGPTVTSHLLVAAADGKDLYGVLNGTGCLSKVDPHGFDELDRTCAVAVGSHDTLFPSPDGRWLLDASTATLRLFRLPTVFSKPVAAASWSLRATDVGWLADGTFAVLTPDGLVRLGTDDGSRTPVPVPVKPDGGDSARTLVADLTLGR
jgi:hypothetical protein